MHEESENIKSGRNYLEIWFPEGSRTRRQELMARSRTERIPKVWWTTTSYPPCSGDCVKSTGLLKTSR